VLALESEYPSEPPSLMERVIHYIQSHYRESIGLYDVARAVGRSPAYLTDRVRRETGRTVLRWIIDCRMQEARHLLQGTEMTVYSIANVLGYTDTSHFIRQFRQYHGVSPQTWRDQHRD